MPFRVGEVVLTWENTRALSASEFEALPADERRFTELRSGKIFLVGVPERYVNHSCTPNTKPGDFCDIAVCEVAAGEEITTDLDEFFLPEGPFHCTFGSTLCRGLIRGKG